eukprot:7287736-Pyramimonas_sp.AAC.1
MIASQSDALGPSTDGHGCNATNWEQHMIDIHAVQSQQQRLQCLPNQKWHWSSRALDIGTGARAS